MRYRNRRARRSGGISGAIILIGIALAFVFGAGGFFLPIFFVFLAFSMVVGSLGSLNPGRIYGTLIGAMWMIILAIFFLTGFHFWPIFLIGAALSAILGALRGPIMAALLGMGLFGLSSMNNQPQQPYYQPPPQPQQPYYQPTPQPQEPMYQPYQQGYQPPLPQPEVYQEGGQQHQYPQQYDQPQAQYPQQQPPMQQQ